MSRDFTEEELGYLKSNVCVLSILANRYREMVLMYTYIGELDKAEEFSHQHRKGVWELFEETRVSHMGMEKVEMKRIQTIIERMRHGDEKAS